MSYTSAFINLAFSGWIRILSPSFSIKSHFRLAENFGHQIGMGHFYHQYFFHVLKMNSFPYHHLELLRLELEYFVGKTWTLP